MEHKWVKCEHAFELMTDLCPVELFVTVVHAGYKDFFVMVRHRETGKTVVSNRHWRTERTAKSQAESIAWNHKWHRDVGDPWILYRHFVKSGFDLKYLPEAAMPPENERAVDAPDKEKEKADAIH